MSCRRLFDRNQLLRIVRAPDGEILFHAGQGRSAYLCRRRDCLVLARKGKKLEKTLRVSLPENFWSVLEREEEWLKNI